MADFADMGIRLHRERHTLTWAEFHSILTSLLQTDSRLWRHFTTDTDEEDDDGV